MIVYYKIIDHVIQSQIFILLPLLFDVKLQFRKCLQVKAKGKSKRISARVLIEFY